MNGQSRQIIAAIVGGVSLLAITSGAANAVPRPDNAEFCPAVLQGVRAIIDDFGLEKMRPMVGGQTGPRLAAFMLDEYFEPLFGLTLADIPADQRRLWIGTFRACKGAQAFQEVDGYYGIVLHSMGTEIDFIYEGRKRYFAATVEAYAKVNAYLQDGFPTIEPTMAGYLAARQLQDDIVRDLAIVRPSRLAEVFDQLAEKRAAVLDSVVASEEQRLAALEPSLQSLREAISPGDALPASDNIPEAEQVLFRRLDTIRADKAAEISAQLLADLDEDEQILAVTRDMLNIIPASFDAPHSAISEARFAATQRYVPTVTDALANISDPREMADLNNRAREIFSVAQDQDNPAVRQLMAAIASKSEEVQQIAYKAGCTEHLSNLGIRERMFEVNVLASRGSIPFWQFMCAMHERNIRVASFSEPGFFSSIYELKATLPNGDHVTLNMKETDASADGKALVGVDIANAVDTTAFTLESWKAFVSQASGH